MNILDSQDAKVCTLNNKKMLQHQVVEQQRLNQDEDDTGSLMILKERPSAALPVTLSFGDITISPDESIMGSTSMGCKTKLTNTEVKKKKSKP